MKQETTYHITAFTAQGIALAEKIQEEYEATLTLPKRLGGTHSHYETLKDWVESHFQTGSVLIFVGACGIAVRAIAPFIVDKYTDPAVLVVDQQGNIVIPLLSGHVGGANQEAIDLAQFLGGIPAISTATDLQDCFAVDVWAKEKNLILSDRVLAKELSAQVLEGTKVRLSSDFPIQSPLPTGVSPEGEGIPLAVSVYQKECLSLIPHILHLGIGCRKGKSQEEIRGAVLQVLGDHGLDWRAIATVGTIDLKAEEEGLLAFCHQANLPFHCHSKETLAKIEGDFTPSAFVEEITGVDNVCERSAVAEGGTLLVRKVAIEGVTVAISQEDFVL